MLASWGRVVHRLRWWLVALSLLPLALWLAVVPGERLDESVVPPEMESVRAVRILDEELAPRPPSFGLIFSSATLSATDPRFVAEVRRALVPLRGDPRVARIRTPWDGPAPDPRSISADGRRAAVMVELVGRAPAFASMVVPSAPPEQALARTLATAGRTVVFSGMTVGIGLLGMILLRMGSVSTIGIASTVVVGFAVLYSLTLLPALLAILGPRVNALPLWRRPARPGGRSDIWHRLAAAAMARPWHVLVPVAIILVVLGLPFRHIHLGTPDISTLPESAESRRGQELLAREFPQLEPNSIVIVLRYPDQAGLTAARVDELIALSRWLRSQPGVTRVDSVVDLDPRITREQYQQMASAPREMLPPPLREAFARMAGPRVAVLVSQTPLAVDSQEARALVQTVRRHHPPVPAELLVTGRTAYDVDFVALVVRVAPGAVAFVLAATYVPLFLLLGSVLLPLKAVVMHCLSVTASYGALVWIFQDGHFKDWLGFTPGPIEPVIPLIMFCVLFGLSMDYEVLLLSRTHEEFERTHDNDRAVVASLAATGRLITGAALIMATVFFGFGAARAVMIKEMGIGMGIAIVMDATVIRALLVPATMRLLGDWNWWAPGPLKRLWERLRLPAHAL